MVKSSRCYEPLLASGGIIACGGQTGHNALRARLDGYARRRDRSRENGAFANAGGRPSRINAA